ncbi:uncharacterized protein UV8b_00298 [Ustilaginoidea virens]|uniref:Mediator of RNA polymerase II transcription subunit 1 n=1 Tax=Ustilaginoidea virens TaxID=1159556 RepID=A0A063C156_USTVR|nr:uncharacterized protein UV8b_00298 [Ustilaginoidea virens]QUC16057.1 hypothetical protein UV8b_00298 [Ustilaginoidea virens]GAO16344.1 hypothetical protein UVI_02049950 [Ustilaginoidea virens]
MATPTPMKHAPSQQGRTPSQFAAATPPVSTPFSNAAQAAFSPRGPKSSPQQVKKSPATSSLLGHSAAMGAFNFDSPSTAAAMGALGMGAGFDIALDNVGVGVGVGVGGLDAIGAALANEDDKLKRLDTILKILSASRGLVSEAGLERLAQQIGLELLSEEQRTPGGRKTRTLAIAGSAVALDIVLDNNIVQSVTLSYHGSAPSVSRHMDAAGRILLQDLTLAPGQSPLTKSLRSFASNFERLAGLDKLSIVPGLDCHEALAGIYASLERLYQWDMSKLRDEQAAKGKPDHYLSDMAMCSRHGRPVMHERGTVGLAIQYWKERRFAVPPADEPTLSAAKKDGDSGRDSDRDSDRVWSLLLGCAPLDGSGVPPVRVSDNWLSKDITKEDAAAGPAKTVLDWQEPENVSLPQSDDNKDAGMDLLQPDLSTTRVPRVMFTVTFDPPVVLPQNDWARLYMYASVNPPNPHSDMGQQRGQPAWPPTYDSLLFPFPSGAKVDPSESRAICRRRRVRVFDRHHVARVKHHRNTLFVYKPIYSQTVHEMPFSHPRQLLDMLPLLRQHAFLAILLENSFGSSTTPSDPPPAASDATTKDQLSAFVSGSGEPARAQAQETAADGPDDSANLDVILWVHPVPHLQVVFPMGAATANVSLKILEGGVVDVVDENILHRVSARKDVTREKMGKVLEHMEDLCKWAEWIRSRL